MLDKNNSILWDYYRGSLHLYANEALQGFTLGASMCIVIDQFIEEHAGFSGERELFAIHGMANQRYEKYQSYAAAYGRFPRPAGP